MLGRPATAAGVTLTLRQMTGQLVHLDLEGDRTKFLKIVGYNAKNEQVTDLGSSGNCCGDDRSIKVRFVDDVRTIKAYIASDFIERRYPFALTQPKGDLRGLRGDYSTGSLKLMIDKLIFREYIARTAVTFTDAV